MAMTRAERVKKHRQDPEVRKRYYKSAKARLLALQRLRQSHSAEYLKLYNEARKELGL